uniref:G-protein coupled receptors family 1 profile domain-containing protein n=1 Tax=Ditylenchus dipsaci TaxID=166011 RepID=A0A915CNP8_9BILA
MMMVESTIDRFLIVAYFLPVFCVGMAGNFWVIYSVVKILYKTWSPVNNVFKHMSLYILSLSIADMFVLCMVPMLISYFIGGSWQFGFIGCKLFFAVENVNKLLSVAILAVMSFERFLAVSRPFHWCCCRIRRKRISNVLVVVMLLLVVIVILCMPMIYYAETSVVYIYSNGSMLDGTVICGSNLPDSVMSFFIIYMFCLGFVFPLLFITLCYFFLIRHLRKNDGKNHFVTSYTTRVVRSVLRVVLFHFACWSPFWLFVLIPMLSYFGVVEFSFLESEYSQTIRMISSFLPYLNSAGNWIFYAAMNRELRETVTVISRKSRMLSSLPACKRTSTELNLHNLRNFWLRTSGLKNFSQDENFGEPTIFKKAFKPKSDSNI